MSTVQQSPETVWKASMENGDPAIKEGFDDLKAAVLTGRTDIVRVILSLAQTYRKEVEDEEDDEVEPLSEEERRKRKKDDRPHFDLLQFLLDHKDHDAGTCLHYATKIGHVDVVRALLSAGADPNIANDAGLTPIAHCNSTTIANVYAAELFQSAALSKTFRLKQLLDAGISVNSSDGVESDNKLIHWAVCFSDLETLKIIIEHGADINSVNGDGITPLHEAVIRGDEEILIELLKHEPLLNIVPYKGKHEGKRVYDLAQDQPKMKEILLKYDGGSAAISNRKITSPSRRNSNGSSSLDENDVLISLKHNGSGIQPCVVTPNGEITPFQEIVSVPKRTVSNPSLFSQKIIPNIAYVTCQTSLDVGTKYLFPKPRHVSQYKGIGFVPPIQLPVCVMANGRTDHTAEVRRLWASQSHCFATAGISIIMDVEIDAAARGTSKSVHCFVDPSCLVHRNQYRIKVATNKIIIISNDVQGMAHAILTLLQCCEIFRNRTIPLLQIDDWPTTHIRGVVMSSSNGLWVNMDVLCETVNRLADFKTNQLHFPIDAFLRWPTNSQRHAPYSSRDLARLTVLCEQRGLLLVPYLRCQVPCCTSCDVVPESFLPEMLSLLRNHVFRLFSHSRNFHLELTLHECTSVAPSGFSSECSVAEAVCSILDCCHANSFTLYINADVLDMVRLKIDRFQHGVVFVAGPKLDETPTMILQEHRLPVINMNDMQPSRRSFLGTGLALQSTISRLETCHFENTIGELYRYNPDQSLFSPVITMTCLLPFSTALAWNHNVDKDFFQSTVSTILERHCFCRNRGSLAEVITNLTTAETLLQQGGDGSDGFLFSMLSKPLEFMLRRNVMKETQRAHQLIKKSVNKITAMSKDASSLAEDASFSECLMLANLMLFLCRVLHLLALSYNDKDLGLCDLSEIQKADVSNKLIALRVTTEAYFTKILCDRSIHSSISDSLNALLTSILPSGVADIPQIEGAFVI